MRSTIACASLLQTETLAMMEGRWEVMREAREAAAHLFCCDGLQCISSEMIIGSLEVTKAHSATAATALENG
jgi:hypothetical protein